MQKDLLEENITQGKIFTVKTIVLSAFFGGLLAAGFMLYQNFKTFGDNKKATLAIIGTILVVIALAVTASIPALEKIPNFVYSLVITLIASGVVKIFQETSIDAHIIAGGKLHTTGRAVVVCIITIAIMIVFILGAYLLQDAAYDYK
jgi:uncharacterized membrane protein